MSDSAARSSAKEQQRFPANSKFQAATMKDFDKSITPRKSYTDTASQPVGQSASFQCFAINNTIRWQLSNAKLVMYEGSLNGGG